MHVCVYIYMICIYDLFNFIHVHSCICLAMLDVEMCWSLRARRFCRANGRNMAFTKGRDQKFEVLIECWCIFPDQFEQPGRHGQK